MWTSDTIYFEERRHPGQGNIFVADAMMDFQVSVLDMNISVEILIQRKKSRDQVRESITMIA